MGTTDAGDSEGTIEDPIVRQTNVDAQLAQQMTDESILDAIYVGEDNVISTEEDLLAEMIRVTTS